MHFDDRLVTVLRARVGGDVAARTQFRQLVDLLGTLPSDARSDSVDAAWVRLAEVSQAIPVEERAAALSEPGLRLRSPRLVAELVRSGAPVASAALRAARLSEAQWLDLVPALPVPVRGLVRQRRDLGPQVEALLQRLGIAPRGLPAAGEARNIPANDVIAANQPQPAEGIGAIVQRIEAYRKRKAEAGTGAGSAPRAAADRSGDLPAIASAAVPAFAFTCDEAGRISWAENTAAAAVIDLRIAARDLASAASSSEAVRDAFRRRQPIRAGAISLIGAPAVAGDWLIDAAPVFDPLGRFTGYRGRFRRLPQPNADSSLPAPDSQGDQVRQLLHELRTPVNAIQGFAEVIQQQLFGPTPHEYRAHAAAIAGDAARMLAGFDELERLAKLDTGAMVLEPGQCDLAALVGATVQQLNTHLAQRSSSFDLAMDPGAMPVALDAGEAERLIWRVLATLAGAVSPGETLRLKLRRKNGMIRMAVSLPATLAAQDDPFHAGPSATPTPLSAGMFGTGFALRLAAGEACSAAGKLEQRDDKLRLELPEAADRLTPDGSDHNQIEGLAG